jgi:hypothetical protein
MKFDFLHIKRLLLIGFAVCLLLSSCQSNDKMKDEKTLLPTKIISTQPPAFVSIPTKVPQYQTLGEVLNDNNYLKDCKLKYPPVYSQQAGFLEIYPGITKANELINRLGEPRKHVKTNTEEEYIYSDADEVYVASYSHLFFVKNNTVDSIIIRSTDLNVKAVLEKYGCPDLINAQALSDDPFATSIEFNRTTFWYLHAGIWIDFENYPINISDIPISTGFDPPSSLISVLSVGEYSKFVSFSEAIIDK